VTTNLLAFSGRLSRNTLSVFSTIKLFDGVGHYSLLLSSANCLSGVPTLREKEAALALPQLLPRVCQMIGNGISLLWL